MTKYDKLMLVAGVLLAFALVGSVFLDAPQINNWVFRIATLIILATSWNLMAGAGLISLGHSAFWGVGSYFAVLVANFFGVPFFAALGIAATAGLLMGALIAYITGSLRGIFFAIMTLALSEGLRVVALMLPDVTGGAVGVYLAKGLRTDVHIVYLTAALLCVLSVVVAAFISSTRLHFASRAMRDDEDAAQMLGVNPRAQRVIIVSISGALASLAGALSGWYSGYLDPDVAFTLHNTILAQIAPILGGIYSLSGPVLGSIALVFLSEGTRILFGQVEGASQLIFGVLLVACILFMPNGIQSLLRRKQSSARVSVTRHAGDPIGAAHDQ